MTIRRMVNRKDIYLWYRFPSIFPGVAFCPGTSTDSDYLSKFTLLTDIPHFFSNEVKISCLLKTV